MLPPSYTRLLLEWYAQNKRDLPWRNTKNPYHVWLSEIILQQTRVNQGLPYYERFISQFPDVHALAIAPESEVLKAWEGLGYYSRARNLHAAAQYIVNDLDGIFPTDHAGLIKLPGVGPYTAAAVSSICYGEAMPVIDGNVNRFISRMIGLEQAVDSAGGRKSIREVLLPEIETAPSPGEFNQALMEFGATYCTPSTPACPECIFAADCVAHKQDLVDLLPIKKARTKVRDRYFDYHVLLSDGHVFLHHRTARDIWKGLYEFILQEHETNPTETRSIVHGEVITPLVERRYSHVLSHQRIHARFLVYQISRSLADSAWKRVPLSSLHTYPMARISTRFLEENGEVLLAKDR